MGNENNNKNKGKPSEEKSKENKIENIKKDSGNNTEDKKSNFPINKTNLRSQQQRRSYDKGLPYKGPLKIQKGRQSTPSKNPTSKKKEDKKSATKLKDNKNE